MLTNEKADLINLIFAHQRELSQPVRSRGFRIAKFIATSLLMLWLLKFYAPIAKRMLPIVNLLVEAVIAFGIAALIDKALKPQGKLDPTFEATVRAMTLEELQGLERDLALMIRERGDRAFFPEALEDKIIGFGTFVVFCVVSFVCYTIAMSMRGFGSVTLSLIFTFGGGALVAGVLVNYFDDYLRAGMRFLGRHRSYIFYGVLILAHSYARFTAK